jgi:P-type E1-E2 ATPase
MICIDIPGFAKLELHHAVFDYNGTLALDGKLLPGLAEELRQLAHQLEIHVITADTFGIARAQLESLPVALTLTPLAHQAQAKQEFVQGLGAASTVAIGNGRNDRQMLQAAALGIALVQEEGACAATVAAADVVCASVHAALALLRHPRRLIATLRS